jgi:tRNA (mo5U34)-methyltransferase
MYDEFDVVLFLGVLYHMKHPLMGLEKCYSLTKDLCIIESHVDNNIGHQHFEVLKDASYMRFIPDNSLNNDHSNWWSPSVNCIIDMCKTVGFSKTECIFTHHNRAIFHAYK